MPIMMDLAANPATGPTLRDPTKEYVVGGPWGGFTVNGGFLIAGAVDDVVNQVGPRIYELMGYDDAVASSLALLKAATLAEGLQLTPAVTADEGEVVTDGDRLHDIELSYEINEFCKRCLKHLDRPVDETLWEMMDALQFGCMMAELVFDQGEGQDADRLVLRRFAVKPRWAWAFRVNPQLIVEKIRAWTTQGWVDVAREHFAILTWQPREGDPRGSSVCRPAYMPFNLKVQTYPDYGEYLKKFASANLVLTAGPNAQDRKVVDPITGAVKVFSVQDQMLHAGKEFKNHSVLGLPHGATATVLQSSGTGEAFDRGFDRFDRSIFRSIVLATRPMQEAKHGSKADTDSGMDLFSLAVGQCRRPVAHMVVMDVLKRCVELNWGPVIAERLTPKASFGLSDHLSPEIMRAFAEAWNKGLFDTSHRPWMWAKLGAPVPAEPELPVPKQPPVPDEAGNENEEDDEREPGESGKTSGQKQIERNVEEQDKNAPGVSVGVGA
jgi:hypothetical protein